MSASTCVISRRAGPSTGRRSSRSGSRRRLRSRKAAAFGPEGRYGFWVAQREPYGTGTHVAFACDDRETVDAFHAAALAAGGTDNGAPGLREHYHPGYYGAFVLDPDGNNVEAVCHKG